MTTLLKPFVPWVAIAAFVGFCFFMIIQDAKTKATEKVELEQTKRDLATERLLRQTELSAYVNDAARATGAYERLREFDLRVEGLNDYVKVNPTSGNQCLDGTDTDQLRNLWK